MEITVHPRQPEEMNSTRPTAIIADDEPMMREALRDQLMTLWPELLILEEVGDGPAALRALAAHRPDVAFLDIRMPGLSGLQVAQLIDGATKVVFVTAYDNHALEAFEASAVDYILKPLEVKRLAKVVAKLCAGMAEPANRQAQHEALQRLNKTQEQEGQAPEGDLSWLHVSTGQQVRLVHVDDVMYFESDTKYTRVVSNDVDGLIRTSLKDLTAQLPSAFVQIHRSAIVNRHFVKSVHKVDDSLELEMKTGSVRLKVSEANRHHFRAM